MDKDWLASRLGEGRSIESLARELGRSPSTVQHWVKKHGLRSAHADRHAARGGIDRERLEELVREGWPIRSIAAELEVSYATVRHWLDRHGLETERGTRLRLTSQARAEGLVDAVLRCPVHGETAHRRRHDGAMRCLVCRAEHVAERRRTVKAILVREHGGACRRCGYAGVAAALHFHHVDPATKRFSISLRGVSRSLAEAREEAARCVLLCANCHAEVESGQPGLPLTPGPADTLDERS